MLERKNLQPNLPRLQPEGQHHHQQGIQHQIQQRHRQGSHQVHQLHPKNLVLVQHHHPPSQQNRQRGNQRGHQLNLLRKSQQKLQVSHLVIHRVHHQVMIRQHHLVCRRLLRLVLLHRQPRVRHLAHHLVLLQVLSHLHYLVSHHLHLPPHLLLQHQRRILPKVL